MDESSNAHCDEFVGVCIYMLCVSNAETLCPGLFKVSSSR